MKVCELIEWLKREDALSDVEIEIKEKGYENITTFSSKIDRVVYLGEFLNTVRIIATRLGRFELEGREST